MRKVINGKTYDTKTAERLCDGSNDLTCNDFGELTEHLYRSPYGQYFVAGSGGAMSKYGRTCGNNSWGWGEGIKLVTASEAKRYLEEHGSAEEFEAVFTTTEG